MKTIFRSLLLSFFLLTGSAQAADETPDESQLQQWMREIMANVDFSLLARIQQTVVDNMALIGPYSQEYYQCLRDEGALESKQSPTLEQLIEQAKTKGKNCHFILQALFEQMHFDISEEEFEQGLSPKYRDLLKQSS